MAFGPITVWQIDWETTETVKSFLFLGSKITADDYCSCAIKRHLLLGGKSYDKHSVLKSRDITLLTKVCTVKAMVFPAVRHGCESWTLKKAEHQRINAFKLWCWRGFLRVPWTARRSNSLEKTLMMGKIEDRRRKGQQDEMIGCHHQLKGCEFEQALGDGEGEGSLVCCSPWSCKELDMTEQLNSDNVPVDVDLPTEEVLSGCPFL